MEKRTSAHVLGATELTLSEDKLTAMITLQIAGEDGAPAENFALTLPTQQLEWWRGLAHNLVMLAARSSAAPKSPPIWGPKNWEVGMSDQLPNMVVLVFDPQTPMEMVFAFPNLAGLAIAKAIEWDILGGSRVENGEIVHRRNRLSMEDRQRQRMIVKPKSELIVPGR